MLVCSETPISGLKILTRSEFQDKRGRFARLFCAEELEPVGWTQPVAQINHSITNYAGTVRGMHYQKPPHGETKLVSCIKGSVFDVAIDLRKDSPTFLKWHAQILSESNKMALLIPKGMAHGFQSLEDDTELIYVHSTSYTPSAEAGLNALDPRLAITWPLPPRNVSDRDATFPEIDNSFFGIET